MPKLKRRKQYTALAILLIVMQLVGVSLQADPTSCSAGSYLKLGSASAICRPCEPGYFCVGGTKSSTSVTLLSACAPGTYSGFGAASCTPCPAGYACASPAARPVPCGPRQKLSGSGYECTYSGVGASSCTVWTPPAGCSSGLSCPDATHVCTAEGTLAVVSPGQAGNYLVVTDYLYKAALGANMPTLPQATDTGIWLKTPCPGRYQCTRTSSGNNAVTRCMGATYSAPGEDKCTICPLGHYCPVSTDAQPQALSVAPLPCPDGQYQSDVGQSSCTICPKGAYCASAAVYPKACRLGEYAPEPGRGACTPCPAGYACPVATAWPVPCGRTEYSAAGQAQCSACPFGYECLDLKSKVACAAGFYTFHEAPCAVAGSCPTVPTWENEGKHYCKECPAGSQCKHSDLAPVPCPQGYYALSGATKCVACPAGQMCPSTASAPVPCQLGSYQDQAGQSFCKQCPDGYKCPDQQSAPVACTANQITAVTHQSCIDCPPGYACPSKDLADVVACEAGTYSLAGHMACRICPRSNYCPKTTAAPLPCPAGQQTLREGQTSCNTMSPGWLYMDQTGLHFKKCLAGQYSNAVNVCLDCPAGKACPERHEDAGNNHLYDCPVGTYSNATQTHCTPCPPGFACASTSSLPAACTGGTYSLGGWTACAACPLNYQCPYRNSISICPVYHQSPLGELTCTPCPAGKECIDKKLVPQPCAAGYYADTLDERCQMCPIGHRCPGGGTVPESCPAGTFASGLARGACDTCPTGYFSAAAAEFCQPIPAGWQGTGAGHNTGITACPAGTYSDWGEPTCTTCPDGFVCPPATTSANPWEFSCPRGSFCAGGTMQPCPAGKTGIVERATSEATGCMDCPAGFACPAKDGNFELHPCPRGGYCEGGVGAMTPCPAGYYNDLLYGQSIGDCKLCLAGRQCAGGGVDSGPVCSEGHYCPRGTIPGTYPCPKGTYGGLQKGLKDVSECLICPAGHYCGVATVTPTPAPAGYYQPNQGVGDVQALYLCPPRFHCPNTGMVNYKGFHCAPGYYCPAASTRANQEPCPAGTYSDRFDLHDPLDCVTCPRGFRCAPGATSKNSLITACPANHYCPEGTHATGDFAERPCPAGYKSEANGKSLEDCVKCSYGTYCLAGAGEAACPKGHYCPLATESAQQFPCPQGYYNAELSKIDILDCLPCGVGHFCLAAAEAQSPCLAGTHNSKSNTEGSCTPCPAGSYCASSGLISAVACPAGSYSAAGASECTDCLVGHFCPNLGTTEALMRVDQECPAGVLCRRVIGQTYSGAVLHTVQTSATNIGLAIGLAVWPNDDTHGCPRGQYCPRGTAEAKNCPAGTYNPAFAQKDEFTGCRQAEPGHYVSIPAQSSTTASTTSGGTTTVVAGECAAGHYCPAGSTSATQVPCPVGTFRSITAGQDQKACGKCPAGFSCSTPGLTTPVACLVGHYCSVGAIWPEPCPIGTYGASAGLTDSFQCTPCQAGRYCWTKGATSTQIAPPCDAGFYCMGGAFRPEPTDQVTGSRCPAGSTCLQGVAAPLACPAGQFNPNEGAREQSIDCVACWAGSYCSSTGTAASDTPCPAGSLCPAGTATPSILADKGHFAPKGSSVQYKCPPGTYQDITGQGSCKPCIDGHQCDAFGLDSMTGTSANFALPSAPPTAVLSGSNTDNTQIQVTWAPLTGASTGGDTPTMYQVYWDQGSAGSTYVLFAQEDTNTGFTYTYTKNSGIVSGTSYKFKYRVSNSVGQGPFSAIATIQAAAVPIQLLQATTANNGVNVVTTWPLTTNDKGAAVLAYRIKFEAIDSSFQLETTACDGTSSTIVATRTCTIPMAAFTAAPFNLVYGNQVAAQVEAMNSRGYSPASVPSTANAYIQTAPIAGPVVARSAHSTSVQIEIFWAAVTGDPQIGGAAVTQYRVYTDGGNAASNPSTWGAGTTLTITSTGGTARTLAFPGLTPGSTHRFAVAVENVYGVGPKGPIASIPATSFPGQPHGLTAGAITATSLTFTFTSPLANGGLPITSYKIYYDNGAGQTGTSIVYAYLAAVTVASPTLSNAATTATYTASGLTTATAYNFKVAAVNSFGVGQQSAGDFKMITS